MNKRYAEIVCQLFVLDSYPNIAGIWTRTGWYKIDGTRTSAGVKALKLSCGIDSNRSR